MSNQCRMTPEQFEALEQMIAAAVVYGRAAMPHEAILLLATDACNMARRLLVAEPEQPKRGAFKCAQCRGVVTAGWKDCGRTTCPFGPDKPTEIDVVTFVEIDPGPCEIAIPDHYAADRFRMKLAEPVGRYNAVDENGELRSVANHAPVRRLPKPEWSR